VAQAATTTIWRSSPTRGDLLVGALEVPSAPAGPAAQGRGCRPSIDNILAFLFGMLASVALQRERPLLIARGAAGRRRRPHCRRC
jgi:hypothetical protein